MEYTGNTYTVKRNLFIQQMTQEYYNKTELYISIFRQRWNHKSPSAIFIIKKVFRIQQSSPERITLQPTLNVLSEGIYIQK